MSIEELTKALNYWGINSTAVTLDGGPYKDGSWVLERSWNHVNDTQYRVWEVFFIDRGNRSYSTSFKSEDDACNFIYNNLKEYYNKK